MDVRYDNALLGILQNEGKIEKFLETIFSFLMRRTDFYYPLSTDQKLGFPPGISVKMVLKTFSKYQNIFEQYQKRRTDTHEPPKQEESAVQPAIETEVAAIEEVSTSSSHQVDEVSVKKKEQTNKPTSKEKQGRNGDDKPVYQADPECYNGAKNDKYTWSQTIKEVDLRIETPHDIKSARDVKVDISRKHLCVTITKNGSSEKLLDRDFCWEIKSVESVWTLHPEEKQMHISLEKVQERWWEAVFPDEEKIDTRKIDCSRPMHELDDEAQAKIQQLMYDEEQKRQGLPTSEQQKVQNILAKAWDQEGSPFRGTPFSPSDVNVSVAGDISSCGPVQLPTGDDPTTVGGTETGNDEEVAGNVLKTTP